MTPEETLAEIDRLEKRNQELMAGSQSTGAAPVIDENNFAQGVMKGAGWIGDGTPQNPGGAWGELQKMGQGLKQTGQFIGSAASGAWDSVKEAANNPRSNPLLGPTGFAMDALGTMGKKAIDTMYQGTSDAPSIIDRTGEIVSSGIPVVGKPLYQAGRDALMGSLKPAATYGEQAGQDIAMLPAQIAMASAPELAGMVKGAGTGIKDVLVGAPTKYQNFTQLADRGAYAIPEALGVGSRNTKILSEASLLDRAAKAAPVFARENPLAGVDVNAPIQIDFANPMQGNKGWLQFENRMKGIKNDAVVESKNIINKAANREALKIKEAVAENLDYSPGLKYDDISLVKDTEAGPYSIDNLATTPERAQGVELAKNWLKEQFGIADPSSVVGLKQKADATAFGKEVGRPLTAQELHDTLIKANAQLRELGRWDDTEWLQQGLNPSMKNAEVEALDFIRERLASSTGEYLKPLIGEDLTNKYLRAKENYGMVSTFEPLMDRAKRAGSEAWATQNARGQQPNSGLLQSAMSIPDTVLDSVAPGRHAAMAKMGPMGAQRTNLMLSKLKDLVDMTNNPASRPLPRGWALIKTSAQNMANFTELGTKLGLINPMMNLATMPDKIAQPIVAQIAQARPQAFEQDPNGFNSVIDNIFHSPLERDIATRDAVEITDPAARAVKMANIFQNKAPTTDAPAQSSIAPSPDLGSLSSLLPEDSGIPTAMPQAMPTGPVDQLTQFLNGSAKHAEDGWH